jgi:hypothetical protein
MALRTQHADRIESWLDGLTTGAGLGPTDPRLHLRNRWGTGSQKMIRPGPDRKTGYLTIVKAWNAYATETPMKILKVSPSESVLAVTGFRRLRVAATPDEGTS